MFGAVILIAVPLTGRSVSESALINLSENAGFKEKPFVLSMIAKPASGCTIRFTTDGSEPTAQTGELFATGVSVSNTIVVRAAVFRSGERISPVITRTYFFLEDVIHQGNDPAGYPRGSNAWNGFPSDYDMSPIVVNDPLYSSRIKESLRALPSLSIAVGREELFGATKGIYIHSQERGDSWERPCSAELFLGDGTRAFQVDCGLRIQGNSNRIPEKTPKRSFRLFFRQKYGAAKLNYRLFQDSEVEIFNTVVLRADFNNTWVHWNPVAQVRGQRIRDAWLKDSQRAASGLGTHTRFAHLYLNGLYWGIYDLTERPDGAFAAATFGGKKEDYDVINELQAKKGQLDKFNALMGMSGVTNAAQYEKVQRMIDVSAFVDYLLVNYYAGNQDWGETKNYYAVGDRRPGGRFHFFCWDGEFILQDVADNVIGSGAQPFHVVGELHDNADFLVLMSDRIQKHFFGNGALTPAAASDRWMKRAAQLDVAIIAESARWGDYRRTPPYTRDNDWIAEQQRLLTNWFPQRTAIVLEYLRGAGFYPAVDPPKFAEPKTIGPGAVELSLSAATNAMVYCTTNGADPRLAGEGIPSPTAIICTNALRVSTSATLKARSKVGTTWSALVERQL